MSTRFVVLAIGIVALAACDRETPRASKGGDLLAAGVPGAVAAAAPADQDSTPMVVRRIWGGPRVDLMGKVSYDGRYLSFVDWETGDLAIRNLTTGETRRLTDKGAWNESGENAEASVVSPDGEQVAYAWATPFEPYELRLVEIDEPTPRVLYRDESVEYIEPLAWSVDGQNILAGVVRRDGTGQIVVISMPRGSARVLKNLGKGFGMTSFSPDGRYVIYDDVDEESESGDIYLMELVGGQIRPLVEHPANDKVLGWSPDGKHVLFASDRLGTVGAWLLAVEDGRPSGAPRLVKPDMWRMTPLGFARDGSYYYGVDPTIRNVYVAALDMTTGELLAPPAPVSQRVLGRNDRPAWSPDGRFLAYQSFREGRAGGRFITIRAVESGETREFTGIGHPLWSRDGRYLLGIGKAEDGRFGLYKLDPLTGDREAFDNFWGVNIATPLGLSADGGSLYYKVWLEDGTGIAVRGLEGGSGELLYRWEPPGEDRGSGFERAALSPDAAYLAFNEYDGGRGLLMVMRTSGGEPRVLREFPPEAGAGPEQITWTPDGGSVVFREGDELWRVPLNGGQAVKLALPDGTMRNLCIHPDARRVAYDAEPGGGAEVWVMEDFLPPYTTGASESEKE